VVPSEKRHLDLLSGRDRVPRDGGTVGVPFCAGSGVRTGRWSVPPSEWMVTAVGVGEGQSQGQKEAETVRRMRLPKSKAWPVANSGTVTR
jgi:hypothetical protein